jgi:glyoxylase-like metal-dependent hydrolase (beta-lactamase superfamily II)
MQPEDRLERRLAEVGLGIADITQIVNTHLHPDHCGGNFLFPHAEIIVQREHYQEALAHPEIADELFHRPELHYRLLDFSPGTGDGVSGAHEKVEPLHRYADSYGDGATQ